MNTAKVIDLVIRAQKLAKGAEMSQKDFIIKEMEMALEFNDCPFFRRSIKERSDAAISIVEMTEGDVTMIYGIPVTFNGDEYECNVYDYNKNEVVELNDFDLKRLSQEILLAIAPGWYDTLLDIAKDFGVTFEPGEPGLLQIDLKESIIKKVKELFLND